MVVSHIEPQFEVGKVVVIIVKFESVSRNTSPSKLFDK